MRALSGAHRHLVFEAGVVMQIGMVGLGRMGANMTRRLLRAGHQCVVYDADAAAVNGLSAEGATGTHALEQLIGALQAPRAIWLMVPAGVVEHVLETIAPLLA